MRATSSFPPPPGGVTTPVDCCDCREATITGTSGFDVLNGGPATT